VSGLDSSWRRQDRALVFWVIVEHWFASKCVETPPRRHAYTIIAGISVSSSISCFINDVGAGSCEQCYAGSLPTIFSGGFMKHRYSDRLLHYLPVGDCNWGFNTGSCWPNHIHFEAEEACKIISSVWIGRTEWVIFWPEIIRVTKTDFMAWDQFTVLGTARSISLHAYLQTIVRSTQKNRVLAMLNQFTCDCMLARTDVLRRPEICSVAAANSSTTRDSWTNSLSASFSKKLSCRTANNITLNWIHISERTWKKTTNTQSVYYTASVWANTHE